jgi:hypothetical protein
MLKDGGVRWSILLTEAGQLIPPVEDQALFFEMAGYLAPSDRGIEPFCARGS